MPATHIRVRLKFRDDLTWEQEKALLHKYGFSLHARKMKDYLVVQKYKKPKLLVATPGGKLELPGLIKHELDRRIKNIVGMFSDPDTHEYVIRTRLHNICQTLPMEQAAYIEEWIAENLPEEG